MITSVLFTAIRILQLITLPCLWGILAYFISSRAPLEPSDYVVCLFIAGLVGTVWCVLTLIIHRRVGYTPVFIVFVDLGIFAVLVAGLVLLAPRIQDVDCSSGGPSWEVGWNTGVSVDWEQVKVVKECVMMKAVWGLGIGEAIGFAATAALAWHVWHKSANVVVVEKRRRRRSSRSSSQRRRSKHRY